jgi:hypothetical protein
MSCTILIGSNRFTECASIISYMNLPLLQILSDPLRATLRIPPDRGTPPALTIEENRIVSPSADPTPQELKVNSDRNSLTVLYKDVPLLLATMVDRETIVVHVDLRPVGLNIYDDAGGLHIGTNALQRNSFSRCNSAISLG